MDDEIIKDIENQINTKTGAIHLKKLNKARGINVGRWGIIITLVFALSSVGYIFYKLDSFYAELGSERHRAKIEYEKIDSEEENENESEESEQDQSSNVTDDILRQ